MIGRPNPPIRMVSSREKYYENSLKALGRNIFYALVVSSIINLIRGSVSNYLLLSGDFLSFFILIYGAYLADLLHINIIKFALPENRTLEVMTRLLTWFIFGVIVFFPITYLRDQLSIFTPTILTARRLGSFVVIMELMAHAVWHQTNKDSFWNGKY